jgi:uncharacterized protein (TIGR02246 family)
MSAIASPKEIPQHIVAAWAKHDGDAFASVFTEDGTMVLPGGVFLKGRSAIGSYMEQEFAGAYKGTRVTGQPVDVRVVSDGVVVLVSDGGVLADGETTVSDEQAVWATWVTVKQGDGWLLAAYQNSRKH